MEKPKWLLPDTFPYWYLKLYQNAFVAGVPHRTAPRKLTTLFSLLGQLGEQFLVERRIDKKKGGKERKREGTEVEERETGPIRVSWVCPSLNTVASQALLAAWLCACEQP